MKNILFMHGGSGNHGCEALVRTTAKLLGGPKNVYLWTQAAEEDVCYGAADEVQQIIRTDELRKGSIPYFEAQIKKRILKKHNAIHEVFLKNAFKGNVAISIGGDNYCYDNAEKDLVPLNDQIRKYCKKMVLWGCSVGEEDLTDKICEDLAQFDLITARESITYENLKKINPNTYLVADPAFLLDKVELPLPKAFVEGNTVGINVSPLIMKYTEDSNIVLKNYERLIEYILEKTDMSICLIPHVVWEQTDDREPIAYLYEKYVHTGRVCRVDDANAMELKGYISRCRFFVGARTHSTIAAYSTCVPTLVAGYSVKSKGIAKDLFGTYENYVVSVQNLQSEDVLCENFQWIVDHEQEIRTHLTGIMPSYKDNARRAGALFYSKIVKKYGCKRFV